MLRRLETAGIEQVVGIVDRDRKQVLLLDIPESDAQIEQQVQHRQLLKHIAEEDSKA